MVSVESAPNMSVSRDIIIRIHEVENGRIVTVANKDYIVTPDQSVIEVIRVALVNAKLE